MAHMETRGFWSSPILILVRFAVGHVNYVFFYDPALGQVWKSDATPSSLRVNTRVSTIDRVLVISG